MSPWMTPIGPSTTSSAVRYAYRFVRVRRVGRGLFQAGDLHSPFGQTVGGGASLNRGNHSYPQRSHLYAVTSFFRIAIVVCALPWPLTPVYRDGTALPSQ